MAAHFYNRLEESLRDAATHTRSIRRAAGLLELGRAALARIKHGPGSVDALAAHLKAARLA
jgi:hypothetical protein